MRAVNRQSRKKINDIIDSLLEEFFWAIYFLHAIAGVNYEKLNIRNLIVFLSNIREKNV